MSARDEPRPVRNLAAWGYESDASGTRVEVDVWTINRVTVDDMPTTDDFAVGLESVEAVAGDVAKVEYAGAAGTGYRRVSTDEPVSQQAYAGAARSAGGPRTGAGTFAEGGTSGVAGPDLARVIRHGEDEVLPVVREEMRELGRAIGRQPSRDEDEEPVETRPFDGYRNVVRVFPRAGDVWRYEVRDGRLVSI
jgi:hypothetical protein